MANIFRVPVDQQHYQDTIELGQPLDEVMKFLSPRDVKAIEKYAQSGRVRYWGSVPGSSNEKTFERMKFGDELLCYRSGSYIGYGRIVYTCVNPGLARHSWGAKEDGKNFELIYFLDNVRQFKIDAKNVHEAFSYKPGPAMGLTRIDDRKAENFRKKYGSLKKFIDGFSAVEGKVSRTIIPYPKTPYEAQFYLANLGEIFGYDIHIPHSDCGRPAFDQKLGAAATVSTEELKSYIGERIFTPISLVDVIWLGEKRSPWAAFEVVHSVSGWGRASDRFKTLMSHYTATQCFVVGPEERRKEFLQKMTTWNGEYKEVNFISYDALIELYSRQLSVAELLLQLKLTVRLSSGSKAN